MLNDKKSVATVAVKDLKRARKFYEDILGLKPIEGDEATAFSYGTAGGNVLVYQSQYAGTNQATAVTWVVGADLDPNRARPQGQRRSHSSTMTCPA